MGRSLGNRGSLLKTLAVLAFVAANSGLAPNGQQGARPAYPWPHGNEGGTVASRFAPPRGFERLPAPAGSFAEWLRGLPVKPGAPEVHLYDGRLKANQSAHCAILDVDVGEKDLQQCADAVIRLRAEYLFSRGCDDSIRFAFTSGDVARWNDWRAGARPSVKGNRVSWSRTATQDASFANFHRYLETVFTYAGSASLAGEVEKAADCSKPEPGNLYIQGGSPGHSVIVLDVAQDSRGRRKFLLGQSYMPAQEVQVLKNPMNPKSAWYDARRGGPLMTPEWPFEHPDLRRFPKASCE
jgi:hypothetical protein